MALEEAFDVVLPDEEIEKFITVGDLVLYIDIKTRARAHERAWQQPRSAACLRRPEAPMMNRRELLQALGMSSAGAALWALLPEEAWEATMPNTGSHIGSVYPFVAAHAAKHTYPLSFLNERFTEAGPWKREARRMFFDLLLYAPERVEPQAERVDGGDYRQERVTFRTTPEIRVPAYVLIPMHAKLPAPGVVALPDHGGFRGSGQEETCF